MTDPLSADQLVVFFDGDCNLCNGAVNFLIDRDPQHRMQYASLQSKVASQLLAGHDVDPADLDTVVVLRGERVYRKSAALLQIVSVMPRPWHWMRVAKVVPPVLRDALYGLVARNRSRLVKRSTTCRMPDPDRLSRFLD